MKKVLLGFIIASSSFSPIYGVTLDEALSYSYENKESFKIAQQAFYKNIEAFPQALAAIAPTINAGTVGNPIPISNKSNIDPTTGRVLQQDAPRDSVNPIRAQVTVNQPLFNFGSGSFGIKAAQNAVQSSVSAYYSAEQQEILNAITAYLTLIETKESYEAAKTAHQSSQVILGSEQAKYELGQSSLVDVSMAEASLANAEYKESGALVKYETAKGDFTIFFGDLSPDEISWPESDDKFLDSGVDAFKEKVMARNYDLSFAKYDTLAKKASHRSSVAGLLPSVGLTATSTSTYSTPSSPSDSRTGYTVSIGVSAPILNLSNNSQSRTAKIAARSAVYTFDQTLKTTEKKVMQFWETFHSAKLSLQSAKKAVEAYQIAYDGVSNQYALGEKGLTDVLRAEQELLDVKTQNITTKKNYLITLYTMKSMVGDLTAKGLGLKVKYFRPEMELKKRKANVFGF